MNKVSLYYVFSSSENMFVFSSSGSKNKIVCSTLRRSSSMKTISQGNRVYFMFHETIFYYQCLRDLVIHFNITTKCCMNCKFNFLYYCFVFATSFSLADFVELEQTDFVASLLHYLHYFKVWFIVFRNFKICPVNCPHRSIFRVDIYESSQNCLLYTSRCV